MPVDAICQQPQHALDPDSENSSSNRRAEWPDSADERAEHRRRAAQRHLPKLHAAIVAKASAADVVSLIASTPDAAQERDTATCCGEWQDRRCGLSATGSVSRSCPS